jgi:hypothetical protein
MVTLTFCPGLRFCTPIFVPVCDGLGTIVTAFFVGFEFGFAVVVTVGLGVTVFSLERSLIVTLTFCPGRRLSICIFAPDPDGFGTILSGFLLEVGVAEGVGVGFGDGFTVGDGDGLSDGFTVGDGVGVSEGVGVGDGVGEGVGVGDGVGEEVGEGDAVGVGEGVGTDGVTEGGVGVGGLTGATYWAIVIVTAVVVVTPNASVIVTSIVVAPYPDGVPEMTPVFALIVRPAGRVPEVTA